ncbi:hypothetical protein J6590_057464 [Homalodisca vitripennis]|nr:hypothetical protein J6590_057464 [Homalodisca vitripennis]
MSKRCKEFFLSFSIAHLFISSANITPDSRMQWVQRLSQDNQVKQSLAWLLLGWVTAERSCPSKQLACPVYSGGSEVTFSLENI